MCGASAGAGCSSPARTRAPSEPRSQCSHGNVNVRLCPLTISSGKSPRSDSTSRALLTPRRCFAERKSIARAAPRPVGRPPNPPWSQPRRRASSSSMSGAPGADGEAIFATLLKGLADRDGAVREATVEALMLAAPSADTHRTAIMHALDQCASDKNPRVVAIAAKARGSVYQNVPGQ